MGMAAWILFCMLASIGLVQCGLWLIEALGGRDRPGVLYHVVPVYDDPEQVEVLVRSAFSDTRKRGGGPVLLVDMGIGMECRQICDRLACEEPGAYICEKERLSSIIDELENWRAV